MVSTTTDWVGVEWYLNSFEPFSYSEGIQSWDQSLTSLAVLLCDWGPVVDVLLLNCD